MIDQLGNRNPRNAQRLWPTASEYILRPFSCVNGKDMYYDDIVSC
jgi:hypothetical protein